MDVRHFSDGAIIHHTCNNFFSKCVQSEIFHLETIRFKIRAVEDSFLFLVGSGKDRVCSVGPMRQSTKVKFKSD